MEQFNHALLLLEEFFWACPRVCSNLWSRTRQVTSVPAGVHPRHLRWSLMLMRKYSEDALLSLLTGNVDEGTYCKWAWFFIESISLLEFSVVSVLNIRNDMPTPTTNNTVQIVWSNRLLNNIGNDCLVSVDGTDCPMHKFKPFWDGWYKHKYNGPGTRWEVCICICTGHIVSISGPYYPGQWNDLMVFQHAYRP